MTFQALPRHTALSLIGDMGEAGGDRLRKTVVVSLLLHLCLLSVIMGAKFFKKTERPLSAVEVSLVTLPPMEAKPEPKVEKVEKPVPRPAPKPVQSAPIPVPPKPVQTPPPPRPRPLLCRFRRLRLPNPLRRLLLRCLRPNCRRPCWRLRNRFPRQPNRPRLLLSPTGPMCFEM